MRFLAFILALWIAAPAAAADMQPFVRGTWQQILKDNAGKPVVLHFWGLTCAPCLAELPRWAELRKARPDMKVIMIAADTPASDTADLLKTLQKAGLAGVESWSFADAFSERLRFEIDPRWRGEMPRTILIASDGKPTVMVGLADLPAIRAWYDVAKK